MPELAPQSAEELAEALASGAQARQIVQLGGSFSKDNAGGPLAKTAEVAISTRNLRAVRQYEPSDLTISVDAGMPWVELSALLATHQQMIPIDPPWFDRATVGGVVATNFSGPRRRGFGTVRDHVIGMRFANLNGKLVESGGMVVKNVAGLDMGKLLIGSWGTLGAMTSVNFKLTPKPDQTQSFAREFETLEDAVASRDGLMQGVLQPWAIDLVNPAAAPALGFKNWTLLVQAGGSATVMDRYRKSLPGFDPISEEVWIGVREFPARCSRVAARRFAPSDLAAAIRNSPGPAIARAASGILYEAIEKFVRPAEPDGFEMMRRVKAMFDPDTILNPGRLNGLL